MANFHPSDNTLLEYSSGSLDWALSICVAAHMQFCPQCKTKVVQFNSIGGNALVECEPVKVESASFDMLMKRINNDSSAEGVKVETSSNTQQGADDFDERIKSLPKVVQKLIPKDKPLKWSFVSPSLRSAQLETGQDHYEVCFHKIKRGGRVVEHDHRGMEVTLVLEGSFSDSEGNYKPGDYIVKHPGETHRPIAAQDQDCLCLSIMEAPVKVAGLMGKVVNPFLKISPK